MSALVEAVVEVFEVAVFRLVEPDPAPAPGGGWVEAVVRFGGGRLRLWIERADAAPLARCFLGLDDGEPLAEADVHDTVGELANMVCGGALRRLDPIGVARLASPEVGEVAEVTAAAPVWMRCDEGRLACALEGPA